MTSSGRDHLHEHGHDHEHDHGHEHQGGVRGFLRELFVPHTHDAADSVDDALEASAQGVRALKISLFVLLATTLLQLFVVFLSNSVALLADTVHNFADALTAVPLWIAFVLARRAVPPLPVRLRPRRGPRRLFIVVSSPLPPSSRPGRRSTACCTRHPWRTSAG